MNVRLGHHRKSIRLRECDYAQAGAYYVTIVTRVRACLFGSILHGKMRLSEAGHVAEDYWRAIPQHFPEAELGAFVVMPNHIHGILILHDVGAQHAAPLPGTSRRPRVTPGSLGAIVRSYKASVTHEIVERFGGGRTIWERNYYEHIIRNQQDHENAHNYILSNPLNWEDDDENQT